MVVLSSSVTGRIVALPNPNSMIASKIHSQGSHTRFVFKIQIPDSDTGFLSKIHIPDSYPRFTYQIRIQVDAVFDE